MQQQVKKHNIDQLSNITVAYLRLVLLGNRVPVRLRTGFNYYLGITFIS